MIALSKSRRDEIQFSTNFSKAVEVNEGHLNYSFGDTIGRGRFGSVFMGCCKRSGTKWAIKIADLRALSPREKKLITNECHILDSLRHKNIVDLRESFIYDCKFMLVLELMSGGELFDRMVQNPRYSEEEARNALRQIVEAIDYCHDRSIVHRDLKPSNLLYESPAVNSSLKIADFGMARKLANNQRLRSQCGSPSFVAPEIMAPEPSYGLEVDMWSIGVIMFTLLSGNLPFAGENLHQLILAIVSADYNFEAVCWNDISESAKHAVASLLVVDPTQRMTAKQFLAHPWLSGQYSSCSTELDLSRANLSSYNARKRLKKAFVGVYFTTSVKTMAQLSSSTRSVVGSSGEARQASNIRSMLSAKGEVDKYRDEEKDCSPTSKAEEKQQTSIESEGELQWPGSPSQLSEDDD